MKAFCALLLVGLTSAAHVAFPHPGQVTTQYHSQDELGQYSYGYSGGPSAKEEIRTADGVTRGGYSYIDAHGLVQSAAYVSDPVHGFRVAATNLPVGPAVPDKPAVVAAAPAVVSTPVVAAAPVAPVVASAPAVVAAAPVVDAAPAVVEPAVVAAPAVVEPAVVSDALPEIISARLASPYFRTIAHPWSGLVHSLKKRSLAVAHTYTQYPGSTAPLVHAPLVHTPVVSTYSALLASPALHGWTGLHHLLKKRSVLVAPYYAAPIDLYNAAATEAHLIQHHQEAIRNTHGIIPLTNPADAPDVAAVKTHHLLTQAAEAHRNVYGLHHYLKKRSLVAPYYAHPVDLYNAAATEAHLIQHHQEAIRNTHGIIPLTNPADAPDVAAVKTHHLLTQAAEAHRNVYGLHHYLKKRSLVAPLVAAPVAHTAIVTPYASPVVAHATYTPFINPLVHPYSFVHHW